MSRELSSVIERIASFTGQPRNLQLVTRQWYDSLSENDKNMIEGIQKKYPDLKSLYSVYIQAVKNNDVDTVEKLAFEYSGYLPFRWSLGVPYINSKEIFDIIWLKSEVLNQKLKEKAYQYADDDILRGLRDKTLEKRFCRKTPTKEDLFDKDSLQCLSIEEIESLIKNDPGFGNAEIRKMLDALVNFGAHIPTREDILDWLLQRYGAAIFTPITSAGLGYWKWRAKMNPGNLSNVILAFAGDNASLAQIPNDLIHLIYIAYQPNLYAANYDRVNHHIIMKKDAFIDEFLIQPYIRNAILSNSDMMNKYFSEKQSQADISIASEALSEFIGNGFRGSDIMKYINNYELIEALDENITMGNSIQLIYPLKMLTTRIERYLSMKGLHPEWYKFVWDKKPNASKPADIPDQFIEIVINMAIKQKDVEATQFLAGYLNLTPERKQRFSKLIRDNFDYYLSKKIIAQLK